MTIFTVTEVDPNPVYPHYDDVKSWINALNQCYVLEYIDGASICVEWDGIQTKYRGHSVSYQEIIDLFDDELLTQAFLTINKESIIVHCVAYGGVFNSELYGVKMRVMAFDCMVNGAWLSVVEAAGLCQDLFIDFVPYVRSYPREIDKLFYLPSTISENCQMGEDKPRIGLIIRPIIEVVREGTRVIAFYDDKADQVEQEALRTAQAWVDEATVHSVIEEIGYDFTKRDIGNIIIRVNAHIRANSSIDFDPRVQRHMNRFIADVAREWLHNNSPT